MKTTLTLAAVLILNSFVWGQESTTTIVDQNGNQTKVSVACTSQGDCKVWDSTHDREQSRKERKEMNKWCKANHLKTWRLGQVAGSDECSQAWAAKESK